MGSAKRTHWAGSVGGTVKYRVAGALVGSLGLWAAVASAGNGKILPPDGSASVANRIELEVHVAGPAGQAQLDLLKQQMRAANRTICDMTDGNFRISQVTVTQGDATRASGDLWWYPNSGRATAGGVGTFGTGPGVHVLMYGFEPVAGKTGFDGNTVAHELGHQIFGLLDQYPEGPRGVTFDGPETLSGMLGTVPIGPYFRNRGGGSLFLSQQNDPVLDSNRNNSVMQQSIGQVCVDKTMGGPNFGKAPSDVEPLLRFNKACLSNTDCNFFSEVCQTADSGVPELDTVLRSSELSTQQNYDPIRGDLKDTAPTEGIEAKELVLQGFFGATDPPPCMEDATTDTPPHPELGQNCGRKTSTLSCTPPHTSGNNAECDRCLIDKTVCVNTTSCNNGVVDADEECDTSGNTTAVVKACSELGLQGGNVHCGVFCAFELAECSPTLTPALDKTSLVTAAASSTFWTATLAYDHFGKIGRSVSFANDTQLTPVDFTRLGISEHPVYVFARLVTRTYQVPVAPFGDNPTAHEIWQLTFAADAAEFGGAAGGFQELGTSEVELIAAGHADAATPPLPRFRLVSGPAKLFLGFTAPQSGETPTGAFTRNPTATLSLTLKLENLVLVHSYGSSVPSGSYESRIWPRGVLYARSGVFNGKEIPQYAAPGDALTGKISFNTTSGRYESSGQTNVFVRRALSTDDTGIPGFPPLTAAQVQANEAARAAGNLVPLADHFRSDWQVLSTVIQNRWPGIAVATPAGLPQAKFDTTDANMDQIPDQCPDPTFITFNPALPGANDQVVVVLDRSGSMDAEDAPGSPDLQGLARLDFAKAGAESFIRLLDAANEPQFGLVWFSSSAETHVGGMAALRRLVPGTVAEDPVMDQIGVQTVIDTFLRQSSNPPETPVPQGSTGTAAALQLASTLFEPANGGVRMIVLLTDGLANVPLDGSGGGVFNGVNEQKALADVKTVTDTLATQGITVQTVTTGLDAPGAMAQEIATATGGGSLDAPRSQELAPSFLEIYAKLHGSQLARSHREMPRLGVVQSRLVPTHDINVEQGAEALTILMSDNQMRCISQGCPYIRTPRLTDPQGTIVAPTLTAQRYSLWRVPAPRAGTWQLADLSEGANWPAGSESRPWRSLVSALVKNPKPACLANVSKRIVNDDQSVTISVTPYSGQPLGNGAIVTGYMLRPDMVQVPLTFTQPRVGLARRAVIAPSQFVGMGVYTVTARCTVTAGAERDEGENPPRNDDHEPMPPPSQDVEAFTRQVTQPFVVLSNTSPGLPGTVPLAPGQVDRGGSFWGDGDGDKIPNEAEPPGDYDDDKIPNNRDSDADNDDKPDSIDDAIVPRPVGNYERWNNVSGTAVANIPFNRDPDFVSSVTTLEAPTNVGDNFGARITGLIAPATSGNYTFFISGNDNVALFLSTTADQANKVRIAYHNSSTAVREWTKFPTQRSAAIPLQAGQLYYVEAQMKEGTGADHMAVGWLKPGQSGTTPSEITPLPFPASPVPKGDGFIVYEKWTDVPGVNVTDIPVQRPPNFTENRSELRGLSNIRDDYGARMRGWVTAPSTGPYTFWISGDDHVALYLSLTGLAGSKQRIAYHDSYTGELEWNKFSTQRSATFNLVAGKRYYIEALMKEASGTDHFAVGWLKPGQTGNVPSEVIPGRQLSPYVAPVLPPGQVACVAQALPRASASASSQESSQFAASKAIDGNMSTRWSSLFSNPQQLTVDLGQVQYVNRVKLSWENAASADYDLQVSSDNVTYTTVYTDAHGNGGVDDISGVSTTARYVRMLSRARTTQFGNSLFELEVFGDPNENCFAVLGSSFEAEAKATQADEGGCSVAPGSKAPSSLWALLGLAALGLPLRRRRRAGQA